MTLLPYCVPIFPLREALGTKEDRRQLCVHLSTAVACHMSIKLQEFKTALRSRFAPKGVWHPTGQGQCFPVCLWALVGWLILHRPSLWQAACEGGRWREREVEPWVSPEILLVTFPGHVCDQAREVWYGAISTAASVLRHGCVLLCERQTGRLDPERFYNLHVFIKWCLLFVKLVRPGLPEQWFQEKIMTVWSIILEPPILPSADGKSLGTFCLLSDICKMNICAAYGALCQESSCWCYPPFWLLCKECFFQVFQNSLIEDKWSLTLQDNGELWGPGLSTEIWVTHDSASLATLVYNARALFQVPAFCNFRR